MTPERENAMSRIISAGQALASAMAVLFGRRGEVTEQARQEGRSRQALYRQTHRVLEAIEGNEPQRRIEELEGELARRTEEVQSLQARLDRAVEINEDKQAEFASTGQAEGVSLPVLRRLLGVFLGEKTPSVPALGRQSQDAAAKSQELLKVLDAAARPKVHEAAADEIFLGRRRS